MRALCECTGFSKANDGSRTTGPPLGGQESRHHLLIAVNPAAYSLSFHSDQRLHRERIYYISFHLNPIPTSSWLVFSLGHLNHQFCYSALLITLIEWVVHLRLAECYRQLCVREPSAESHLSLAENQETLVYKLQSGQCHLGVVKPLRVVSTPCPSQTEPERREAGLWTKQVFDVYRNKDLDVFDEGLQQ